MTEPRARLLSVLVVTALCLPACSAPGPASPLQSVSPSGDPRSATSSPTVNSAQDPDRASGRPADDPLAALVTAGLLTCRSRQQPAEADGCDGAANAKISRTDAHYGYSGPSTAPYGGAVFVRGTASSSNWQFVYRQQPGEPSCSSIETVPIAVARELGVCVPDEIAAYDTHGDARFGFACAVPHSYLADPLPEDGDGFSYHSADGHVTVACFGSNNGSSTNGVSAASQFQQDLATARSGGRSVTYSALRGNVSTISGYEADGRIYYTRSAWGSGSIDTLSWTYDASVAAQVKAAVEYSAAAFRPGDVTSSW